MAPPPVTDPHVVLIDARTMSSCGCPISIGPHAAGVGCWVSWATSRSSAGSTASASGTARPIWCSSTRPIRLPGHTSGRTLASTISPSMPPTRAQVDAMVAAAPGHGWSLLFADRHPHAGGLDRYAAYLENTDGYEAEIVAP